MSLDDGRIRTQTQPDCDESALRSTKIWAAVAVLLLIAVAVLVTRSPTLPRSVDTTLFGIPSTLLASQLRRKRQLEDRIATRHDLHSEPPNSENYAIVDILYTHRKRVIDKWIQYLTLKWRSKSSKHPKLKDSDSKFLNHGD